MRDVMTVRPRLREAHPALKHGVYSTNTVLPGEDRAAFEELLRGLMDEHKPDGLSECEEVCYLAHLVWRRQNLPTNLHVRRTFEHILSKEGVAAWDGVRILDWYLAQQHR